MSVHNTVALIAHDQNKDDLAAFARSHQMAMARVPVVATGTSGARNQIRPNRDPTHAN